MINIYINYLVKLATYQNVEWIERLCVKSESARRKRKRKRKGRTVQRRWRSWLFQKQKLSFIKWRLTFPKKRFFRLYFFNCNMGVGIIVFIHDQCISVIIPRTWILTYTFWQGSTIGYFCKCLDHC